MAAVAFAHVVLVVADVVEKVQLLELLDHGLAGHGPVHAAVLLRRVVVDATGLVHDGDGFQAVFAPELEVVHVVGRGHLEAARAEFALDVGVGDDGNAPADQGQDDVLADEFLVALVLGMHGHGRVAEHGLGPGGGHGHEGVGALHRIADMVELANVGGVFDFQVGQGGVAARAPVDDVVAPVDEAFLVEAHEHFAHGPGQALVHGEAFPAPVDRRAQAADLVQDLAAVFLAPLPDPFDKGLATEGFAGGTLGGELALHHVLGGDAGMVGAGHPQDLAALLAVVTAQDVLDGDVQGMPHVQGAGYVGRRNNDGIGFPWGV